MIFHPEFARPKELRWIVNENDCWICTSHLAPSNYYPRIERGRKRVYVTRYMYEKYRGPIPEGMCLLHICDNTHCINPNHLFLGTKTDNSNDKVRKNRQAHIYGSRNGSAKLTEQKVLEIKKLFKHSFSMIQIAQKYGVSRQAIEDIHRGHTWNNLSEPTGEAPK